MKVLIVEDQPEKNENIKKFLLDNFEHFSISTSDSLRKALREIVSNQSYDLILLDMSMPAFDPSESYFGDSPESYAGQELMEQMKLRGIRMPVIVVTQYSSFEGGEVALDGLSSKFSLDYGDFYLGYVYYTSANNNWQKDLKAKIDLMRGELS
ncbi:response regulator [Providencia hangzhouensis]|uniref:response regulator n=1 Tax=Providencia hangzhouensis TaxID=3031799 RepID=UPI0034DD3FF8